MLGAAAVLLAVAPPALAATVGSTPTASWSLNGRVYASVVVGDEVILGGDFTSATSPNGASVARAYLAAFQVSTGALLTGFSANANKPVRALATDGTSVYVGGYFTYLKGIARNRIAAVDPVTGAVSTAFHPNVTGGPVLALDVQASRVFAGGSFTSVGTVARSAVAAFAQSTGAVDPDFTPSANGPVQAVRASSDGSLVYLGGSFSTINGATKAGLAQVSGSTGALTSLTFADAPAVTLAMDLTPDGGKLLVGGGGTNNSGAAWRTDTGRRLWSTRTDGDVQAIHYYDGDAYFGFHDGYQGVGTTKILKANADTGAIDTSFAPVFNNFWGNFTIADGNGYLITGGDYTKVSGVTAGDWARFPIQGAAPPPNQTPTAAFAFTNNPDGSVAFDGSGSTDMDGFIQSYSWSFGDGATDSATGATPTHTYGKSGNYDVTLTVTDGQGATSSVTHTVSVTLATTSTTVIAKGATWAWRYQSGPPPAGWNTSSFDSSTWRHDSTPLGFGSAGVTNIDTFADPTLRPLAAYFTKSFNLDGTANVTRLVLNSVADDGAVFYVNGTQVGSVNMKAGPITYQTYAASARSTATANASPVVLDVPTGLLVSGTNTIAAETHLNYHGTKDISFDLAATLTTAS